MSVFANQSKGVPERRILIPGRVGEWASAGGACLSVCMSGCLSVCPFVCLFLDLADEFLVYS